MIWTLFDFCFLSFDFLPPRLPAHASQKSTPPLQGVEICAATNFEIQIKIELRNLSNHNAYSQSPLPELRTAGRLNPSRQISDLLEYYCFIK
jgi:hypothetical protein